MFRLLRKERINNRMSLAIVLKSALTFLHRRNPEFARWPGLPVPRRAVFVPRSHQFTVEVGRQKNTLQKKSTENSKQDQKDCRGGRRGRRRGVAEARRAARFWAPLVSFLKNKNKTNSGFRNANRAHRDPPAAAGLPRWGGRAWPLAPPLPCKRGSTTGRAHSKTFFPKKVKHKNDKYSTPK